MTKLCESHERALSSSLHVIERNLQQIRASLSEDTPAEQTITYRRRDDVNSESKPRILEVITDMLDEIKQVKDVFELETDVRSHKAQITAALTEVWIILVELEPERLNAYGELSESTKALIEPHLQSLQNKLDEVNHLLHPQP